MLGACGGVPTTLPALMFSVHAFRYRVHEFDCAIAAMRRGLAALVPIGLLTALYDGNELERGVCGRPEIDIDLLQRVAHYRGCASTDRYARCAQAAPAWTAGGITCGGIVGT